MINENEVQVILEAVKSKMTLSPVECDGRKLEVGQSFRRQKMGHAVVEEWTIVGFASAETWMLYEVGEREFEMLKKYSSLEDFQIPAVIVKSRGGYEIYKANSYMLMDCGR